MAWSERRVALLAGLLALPLAMTSCGSCLTKAECSDLLRGTKDHPTVEQCEEDARARQQAERDCDARADDVCADLGRDSLLSRRDGARAARYFERGCTRPRSQSCALLGAVLVSGQAGAPRDVPRGRSLLEPACQAGDATACHALAESHADDPARAAALEERACQLGDEHACLALAEALSDGHGVPRDPARALTLYRRACASGNTSGCSKVGEALATGDAGPP